MELRGILGVAYKEHVADHGIETIADVELVLVGDTGKDFLYLTLSVVLRFHLVAFAVDAVEIFSLHIVGFLMEHTLQCPVGDKRCGEALLLEVETIAADLVGCHAKCGSELTEQTVYRVDWNLPDAEEAEHVVDTVSIEELRHVLETAYPPLATVFEHLVPVVSREAPILTVDREVIGWRTGLSVEVEVAWLHPYVAAIAVHANRDVALEDDVVLACVGMSLVELSIEDILNEIPELHFFI